MNIIANRNCAKRAPQSCAYLIAAAALLWCAPVAAADGVCRNCPAAAAAEQPAAPASRAHPTPAYNLLSYEELRIGGRLERITIRRNNGLVETYQRGRVDHFDADHAIGAVPNRRQWIIKLW